MAFNISQDRLYSEEHEWVKICESEALVGISDHAQCSLGDVVYVELPEVGAQISKGAAIGVVESVKAVSDLYAPMTGEVVAVNQNVVDSPETLNQDPYGEGWLIKIKISDQSEKDSLFNANDYKEFLEKEAK